MHILKAMNELSQIKFDELNIWDCYIEWKDYLNDKIDAKFIEKSKFYLNYNVYESARVNIICSLSYDGILILNKLNNLTV